MGQELQIPESFKNFVPAKAFAGLNAQEDNLAEGIGQSYPVIGYKGKVWSLRHRGERKNIVRPDDGTPSSYLDVIILGQAKSKSKSLYKKYDQATSDGDRPICASIDGIVPDPDVTAKQCDTCALCPKNVWKTDPVTGRKGRECTDYKRLAVLILPTQTKLLFGEPLLEPCFLRVPPDSLNSLAIMGETMGSQGFHHSTYITRVTFDPNKAHPCMVFRPLQGLTDNEAPVVLELRADPNVGRITGGDLAIKTIEPSPSASGTAVTGPDASVSQAAQPAGMSSTKASGQPAPSLSSGRDQTTGQAQNTSETQASGSAPTGAAQPATPLPLVSDTSTMPSAVDTGFGSVRTVSKQPNQSTPQPGVLPTADAAQGSPDAGQPEEADADLDARIAALITNK